MINDAILMRMTDKIINYLQRYARLAGAEKREEVLDLFDNMQQLFPHWVISTCPVMHPEIHYMSKNGVHIFGHAGENVVNKMNIQQYFNHVHDADQQDLKSCFSFLHDSLESIPSDEHTSYRAVLHYRFKKSTGQYIYLHDEKATLDIGGCGNLYYALFRDITSEKTFTGVKIELFKQETGLKKIKEYKPSSERHALSKREGELVLLIKQGLSTKEIAWQLEISHNTVRNIKSKLFEKYNVNNMIELLNMTAEIRDGPTESETFARGLTDNLSSVQHCNAANHSLPGLAQIFANHLFFSLLAIAANRLSVNAIKNSFISVFSSFVKPSGLANTLSRLMELGTILSGSL